MNISIKYLNTFVDSFSIFEKIYLQWIFVIFLIWKNEFWTKNSWSNQFWFFVVEWHEIAFDKSLMFERNPTRKPEKMLWNRMHKWLHLFEMNDLLAHNYRVRNTQDRSPCCKNVNSIWMWMILIMSKTTYKYLVFPFKDILIFSCLFQQVVVRRYIHFLKMNFLCNLLVSITYYCMYAHSLNYTGLNLNLESYSFDNLLIFVQKKYYIANSKWEI